MYDASAKVQKRGTSLNDCLRKGPSLNPLLFDVLLRFREKRVALVGDIEKAFLNIEVDKADRDCLRFLWVENPADQKSKIVVYRFCRVVFGWNSSPFLLNATLRHHISKYKANDPDFVRQMIEGFYVDDLVTGEVDSDSAYKLYEKSKVRMASGGFRLRKWVTNDRRLRDRIKVRESTESHSYRPVEEESYAKQTLNLGTGSNCNEQKVLGLAWDCENDQINFHFSKVAETARTIIPTKRTLLSLLATIFDPLGVISPVIVQMKILFQDVCRKTLEWDDALEGKLKQQRDNWVNDLAQTKTISVSRSIYVNPKEQIIECELHGFGDASIKAYCAVVYLVYRTNNKVYSELLTSRSRVAPLKTLTIPRLELWRVGF